MKKLSLHTRIHYLKCKSFGLGFLYSITRNRLFFDKKIRTGIVIFSLILSSLSNCAIAQINHQQKRLNQTTASENSVSTQKKSSNTTSKPTEGEIFVEYDEMPYFAKGDVVSFVSHAIIYPKIAIEKGIEGRVITQFEVEKNGALTDIKVVRGISPELDAEAIRIVKSMPRWIPGKQRNKVCRVKYTLPVNFKLPYRK